MNARRAFLDSGIFIAFLVAKDRHHSSAVNLFDHADVRWYTSALVRSETYSWFLHKYGEDAARQFRRFVDSLSGLVVLDTNPEHHNEVCRVLERLRGSKLTYVDASNLVFMADHAVTEAWATDHHLGLTGVTVVPAT